MANHYRFIIGEENENERVDKVLAALLTDCSRSYLQKLVKQELVLVNNETVKPSTLLKVEDELTIEVPELKIPCARRPLRQIPEWRAVPPPSNRTERR